MATIEEHENSMTLYYSKRNGEITLYSTGIQDMNIFGFNKEDYEIIWDYKVFPKDEMVLSNSKNFKINIETKELEIKQDFLAQYPVTTQ